MALAWATEAFEQDLISEKETLIPLKFGDAGAYAQAVKHLALGEAKGHNDCESE